MSLSQSLMLSILKCMKCQNITVPVRMTPKLCSVMDSSSQNSHFHTILTQPNMKNGTNSKSVIYQVSSHSIAVLI